MECYCVDVPASRCGCCGIRSCVDGISKFLYTVASTTRWTVNVLTTHSSYTRHIRKDVVKVDGAHFNPFAYTVVRETTELARSVNTVVCETV
jgi:hypothetical protein